MSSVGSLLSEYRKSRRLSQLDLSVRAQVSSRHISFIETGRSTPSRDMLLRLSDVLDLTLRDSNLLLSAAGFAMNYGDRQLDEAQMRPVKQALEMILQNHNPYPAVVMDSAWNVVMVNEAQLKMLALLPNNFAGQLSASDAPVNLLEALFDHRGFRPILENWDELAGYVLRRLKKQMLVFNQPLVRQLYTKLLTMDPPVDWQQPPVNQVEGPMVTSRLRVGDKRLQVFSTLTQFGSALDVGMEELVIESYFPADETTKNFFANL